MKSNPLSLFFIFTYLYFITYILNPLLLIFDDSLITQVIDKPSFDSLIYSIVYSIIAFLFILLGYKSKIKKNINLDKNVFLSNKRLILLLLFSIGFFFYIFWESLLKRFLFNQYVNIFEFSNGNGITMLILSSYQYIFIFLILYIYSKLINNISIKTIDYICILLSISILFISSVLLSTRRDIAVVFLIIVYLLAFFKKERRYKYLLIITIFSIPFTSVILQAVRYMNINEFSLDTIIDTLKYTNQFIVSSFEGHWLAFYFDKVNLFQFLLGVNPFEFIGNLLSYIPRVIWESKPYNMGILEIQYFLAPQSFNEKGYPTVTMPSTILVEILYSFGFFVSFFILFYLGKLMKFLDLVFIYYKDNLILVFLFLYIYIYMFGFIRGGSSFLTGLLIPLVYLLLIIKYEKIKKRKKNGF
ncbi:oligosaccharide repeat unit polymerase [Aliarcobacter cryaerophilus]|uniref:O-antigen polymerase n=1 Tax=Aliarcobacter cryaerophilus TaxID=28198 RepID=UPI0021B5A923|nr:O-antigen polymerase [Aliarcobacter cryaerophilus]MCT7460921.1 oligosaccharide repeat unit polymerase [Aliarcobacter cryaerophilus]